MGQKQRQGRKQRISCTLALCISPERGILHARTLATPYRMPYSSTYHNLATCNNISVTYSCTSAFKLIRCKSNHILSCVNHITDTVCDNTDVSLYCQIKYWPTSLYDNIKTNQQKQLKIASVIISYLGIFNYDTIKVKLSNINILK